jgi:hypothetical protein
MDYADVGKLMTIAVAERLGHGGFRDVSHADIL